MNNNKKELTARDLALFLGCPVETPHGRGKLNSVNWLSDHATVTFGAMGPDFDLSMPASEVRPVLRPFSTMTQEELEENRETYRAAAQQHGTIQHGSAASVRYYISIGLDVFGWIPAGLAVDATKKEVEHG